MCGSSERLNFWAETIGLRNLFALITAGPVVNPRTAQERKKVVDGVWGGPYKPPLRRDQKASAANFGSFGFQLFDIVRDRKRNAGGVTASGLRKKSNKITTNVFLERILFSIDQVSAWSLLKGFLVKERNTYAYTAIVAVHIPMDGSSDQHST